MKFDIFVLPFFSGLMFVFIYIFFQYRKWILELNENEKKLLVQHLFSKQIWKTLKEIIYECLLHRKIFKTNPLLGYMHMSLAFGWFILIVLGNIEVKFYSEYTVNPPYVPIFLRYFEPNPDPHFFGRGFNFIMDFLLLFILSGVALAYTKRFRPDIFGMKHTTYHMPLDKLALNALWFIFPMRLLAESFTAGAYHNGSFLTNPLGEFFASWLPVEAFEYTMWWGYSIALGLFFFALPFSRYMHIPSEILLIVFKNAGINACIMPNVISKMEIKSCSRCGICIDTCQLAQVGITNIQPTYFLRDIRYKKLKEETTNNCLVCGRCNVACPVGIQSTNHRIEQRIRNRNNQKMDYSFIKKPMQTNESEIIYFAGCMSHLTPSIKKAMHDILNQTGIKWQSLDQNESICCGRPLLLAGKKQAAEQLIEKNKNIINKLGGRLLVTSCPICFNTFSHDYDLNIPVMHHTQFIDYLIENQHISVTKSDMNFVYHDPCELGRANGIYDNPRNVLSKIGIIKENEKSREKALCCGGSIGNSSIDPNIKKEITINALKELTTNNPDFLVTACPLCKKTFSALSPVPVKDIAEITVANMIYTENKIVQLSDFVIANNSD